MFSIIDIKINGAEVDATYFLDLRFIDAMIPHHEGALVMAKEAISKSKRPEVMKLSQEIMSSQQKEINSMTQWRKAWYNQ